MAPFSVVIPAFNEARTLADHVERLFDGLPAGCEVIYVCNGCTDESADALRCAVGDCIMLIEVEKGKACAIRTGEAQATLFPRFYVDSDVLISGDALARLAAALDDGTELVSPRIVFDLAGAGFGVRLVHRFWLSLPHGRGGAFHHVLGVSARGRARWGIFPDLLADDAFIEAMIPEGRKRIVQDAIVETRPPRSLWSWVRVRERWQRGHRQLRAHRLSPPHVQGQYRAILYAVLTPRKSIAAGLYVGAVLIAHLLALLPGRRHGRWYSDVSSR